MKFIKHWIAATILTLCAAAHGADYYGASGDPATGSALSSSVLRAEYSAIGAGFAKVAPYTGNANKAVVINSGATGQTVTTGTLGLAGNFATTGAFNTTLIQGATTSLTLPLLSGTLATLAGTEELTNKTLNASVGKGTWTTSGTWTLPAVTLGGAITYGGVTLSNSVTGTGKMVLDTAPTLGAITVTSVNGNTLTTGSSTYTGTAGQTYTFPTTSATIARTDAANTFTGVQTMTSPALTTPVINGLPTGTGVASSNTVSTLVARDGSGNFSAGTITASLTGNASGSAATVTGASQTAITTAANLVTVGALNSGSITSGFGSIDVGADSIGGGSLAITGAATVGTTLGVTGAIMAGSGTNSFPGQIDIAQGGRTLTMGADASATTRTNNTNKFGNILAVAYATANVDWMGFGTQSLSATNVATVGGGNSNFYAATESALYAAANNTTTTGTKILSATSTGVSVTGALASSGALTLPGLATSSAATTGTMCWTTGTGNVNVDTTTTCLLSSNKYKQDGKEMEVDWKKVMALKPMAYTLRPEVNPQGLGEQAGFFAEDVATIDPRFVSFESVDKPHRTRELLNASSCKETVVAQVATEAKADSKVDAAARTATLLAASKCAPTIAAQVDKEASDASVIPHAVRYQQMVAWAFAHIQDLKLQVDALTKKLAALESAPVAANDSFYLRMAGALE